MDKTTASLALSFVRCVGDLVRVQPAAADQCSIGPDGRRHVVRFLRVELGELQLAPATWVTSIIADLVSRIRGCGRALASDAEARTLFDQSPDQDLPIRKRHRRKFSPLSSSLFCSYSLLLSSLFSCELQEGI